MQYITKYNSPNYTKQSDALRLYRTKRVVTGITVHHWGDPALAPTFDGVVGWLCDKRSGVSAHLVVEAGRAAWLVDAQDIAWHAGNWAGNASTVGIECNPRASAADYKAVAEVIADLRNVYGDITIFSHDYWTATECPGRWDVHKLDRMSYEVLFKKYGKRF